MDHLKLDAKQSASKEAVKSVIREEPCISKIYFEVQFVLASVKVCKDGS